MGRPSGPKTRCGGRWTESRFNTFVRNILRSASRKWAPIQDVKKKANVARGQYLCAGCKQVVPVTVKQGRKRVQNVFVDHIDPIVDPNVGFVSFDVFTDRLFCEEDNLQVLCGPCHDSKTAEETKVATLRRKNNDS